MQGLLKFMTCGSVDDGKSTLIGRLLYDAKLLYSDQMQKLELEIKVGSREGAIDYSLLLDGLSAEREQGITIDVAYRFFNTDKRSFIVADTPGHEQYTRNMAVGASFADLAILLVDATQGILTQTKRHLRISHMMGVRHFILAINKMDLVEYKESNYALIKDSFEALIKDYSHSSLHVIPVSATEGDNIKHPSNQMPWFKGKTLFNLLETIDITQKETIQSFVMPVQRVSRPNHTFRGFQGTVSAGLIRVGDPITVLPSGEHARVKSLLNTSHTVNEVIKDQAITIQLDKEIDISRGDVITNDANLFVTSGFQAQILWMDDDPLIQGKSYLLKIAAQLIPATILKIKHKVDVNSGDKVPSKKLEKNEIAVCEFSTIKPIVFSSFESLQKMGSFILIDRVSHMTSAGGVIEFPLRRNTNVFTQEETLSKKIRAKQKSQNPKTVWFTGLSGSGKSTLANTLEKRLYEEGYHTMLLDGDNIRQGLNKNLGFNPADRIENIRRIGEVAKLMNDAGLITITSFISPYLEDRQTVKTIIGEDSFIEIYVSTPLDVCEKRDVKGLYKKARMGEIPNFTGISAPYEPPLTPSLKIDTSKETLEEAVRRIMSYLKQDQDNEDD